MHETHGRLATLMFVQVTEATDNKKEIPVAQDRLAVLQKQLSAYVKRFHGDLVEISSGEIFAYFPGAVLAFNAAVSLPKLMPQFILRTGLHVGEVLVRREKLQGTDVNLAARLPHCSRAGGVCLSQTVYQYLKDNEKQKLIALGPHELKNFDIQIPLYAYLPAGQPRRRKTRELQRRCVVILQKHRKRKSLKYFFLLFLALLIGLYSWLHVQYFSSPDQNIVKLYVPNFVKSEQAEQAMQLLDSMEMTVRSQLAGSHGAHQLKLVRDRSSATAELLVTLNVNSGRLRAEYTFKNLANGRILSSGQVEDTVVNIFKLQDDLSQNILLGLKNMKYQGTSD